MLSTDPAAHLGEMLGVPVAGVPNLFATTIDPQAASAAYKARLLADARAPVYW